MGRPSPMGHQRDYPPNLRFSESVPPPGMDCLQIPICCFPALPSDPHGSDGNGDGLGRKSCLATGIDGSLAGLADKAGVMLYHENATASAGPSPSGHRGSCHIAGRLCYLGVRVQWFDLMHVDRPIGPQGAQQFYAVGRQRVAAR